MVIISKGKSVRVTAEPDDEEEKPTKELVEKMRSELHEKLEEEEEEKAQDEEEEKEDED